uniref:Uncharacterized protein n=1 Tax=Sciurus vulgaris TaxID=55149 RepID=A0A8D2JNE6_SCIVU
ICTAAFPFCLFYHFPSKYFASSWRFSQVVACSLEGHILLICGITSLPWQGLFSMGGHFSDLFSSSPLSTQIFRDSSPDMAFSNHRLHSWIVNFTLLHFQDREIFGSVYFFSNWAVPS